MKHKRFPMTSMGDIAFLLLLFFLILAITTRATPVPLQEAESRSSAELRRMYPTIYVSHDGTLSYGDREITCDELPCTGELCIMADRHTPYRDIAPLIKKLRKNGTAIIHCLVEENDAAP